MFFSASIFIDVPAPRNVPRKKNIVKNDDAKNHGGTGRARPAAGKTGNTGSVPGYILIPGYADFPLNASSMAFAAVLPAPMARMTVAAPVTASPPA